MQVLSCSWGLTRPAAPEAALPHRLVGQAASGRALRLARARAAALSISECGTAASQKNPPPRRGERKEPGERPGACNLDSKERAALVS